jgi:hypothetical protein
VVTRDWGGEGKGDRGTQPSDSVRITPGYSLVPQGKTPMMYFKMSRID